MTVSEFEVALALWLRPKLKPGKFGRHFLEAMIFDDVGDGLGAVARLGYAKIGLQLRFQRWAGWLRSLRQSCEHHDDGCEVH